jgi:hypothetical protein
MEITLREFFENKNLDKTKVTRLDCSKNKLTELPDLSSLVNLKYLNCYANKLTKLTGLSSLINLTYLYCSDNQLVELPDLSSFVNLTHLYCSNNQLTKLQNLPFNLMHFGCNNNQITTIPQSIISLRRLRYFGYDNNVIDYIPPNIQRFIQRMRNIQTIGNIYNDKQSVHRSSVTNSVKKSIENLMNDKTKITKEKMITIILQNDILSENVKSRIIQYIEDKEELIHSMVTFEDLLIKVVSRIISHSDPNELFRILNDQMIESECMCLTGRMSRLVSVLDGFFGDIRIGISCSEMISSIILQITSIPGTIEEHKELAIKKLLESGFKLEEIESWIEAIE